MRIHFVLPQLTPFYGMEKAASLLMVALADAGCEVTATVISGSTPPHVEGLEVRNLDIPLGALRLARSVPALRRDLDQIPRDATIVASGIWGSVPLGVALLGTGRTFVAWEHSVLPARLGTDKRVAALHTALGMRCIQPRHVITVSEGVRRAVARRLKGVPSTTIPNIVEVSAAPPASRPIHAREVRLLSASAFRPLKNNVCAVEAMRYLPKHFTLRMAGDGVERGLVEQRITELNLADRVTVLGHVPGVQALLAESDLLIHSSLAETFGFSLVEAADAGLPVVTLPVSAIDELIPEYVPGQMADACTPEAFARAISDAASRAWSSDELHLAWTNRKHHMAPSAVGDRWIAELSGLDADSLAANRPLTRAS